MSQGFVYYKKGRGPITDSTEGYAALYEGIKQGFVDTAQKARDGDPQALKDLDRSRSVITTWMKGAQGLVTREPDYAGVQGVPILNNLSVKYANGELIGTELMPISPVDQISGQYFVYDKSDRLRAKKTRGRGRSGQANEVDSNRTKTPYATEPAELERYLQLATILNADGSLMEMLDLIEDVNYDMSFDREILIKDTMTTPGNYPTDNKTTLLAGARWDDANGKPGRDIRNALAKMWRGSASTRVVAATSVEVWDVLSTHPDMLDLLALSDRGFVSPAQFVDFFGLDGILVSEARVDTSKLGQASVYSRLWGNNFVLARVSTTPQLRNASFGYTLRWVPQPKPGMISGIPGFMAGEGVFAMQWYDQRKGTFGSYHYKRSHFEQVKVVAADTGYLFTTPINGTV